jgi:AraC-like DNA-binding protein
MKKNKLTENNLAISAVFHHGEHVMLTTYWQDKNVICPNSKLFYVTDGEIVIETEQGKIIAEGGDMVLIPAGTKHDFHLSEKKHASKYWLHFDGAVDGENLFDYYTLPFKAKIGKNEYIESLFQTVLNLSKSKKLCDRLSVTSALCSILAFYADHSEYSENTVGDEIDRAIFFIKNHYQEKFSLDELADSVCLSKGYFIKKFKERTGLTPMQYVLTLKIDKAKMLIEQSSLSISAVMEQLGFFDSAHFSKLFKARTGYSPKEFRLRGVYRSANKSL